MVAEYGLPVAAISPGLFKIDWPAEAAPLHFHRSGDMEQFEREARARRLLDRHVNDLLPASIEAAKQLGTSKIVCFDFERPIETPVELVQIMRHAAEQVHAAGLTLVIEVDCNTSKRTADLVRAVDHPGLRINWDPANAYRLGEDFPFPDGYAEVREFVRHVHFKDARTYPNGNRTWTLDGVIDWSDQVKVLLDDGFDGYISVEPHMRPNIAACTHTLQRIRSLIGAASSVTAGP
jgi:sugar phosphate isomerase/epimerase